MEDGISWTTNASWSTIGSLPLRGRQYPAKCCAERDRGRTYANIRIHFSPGASFELAFKIVELLGGSDGRGKVLRDQVAGLMMLPQPL